MNFCKIYIFFLILTLNFSAFSAEIGQEWIEHSEDITILDTQDMDKFVNSKKAILIDVWKKDKKPENLDPKKWFPPQRYSLPGSIWIPNVGLEALTIEQRDYFEKSMKIITKGNKNSEIICFCRSGYYSKIAAERLIKMGYTNISLYPGTDVWEDSGRKLYISKPFKLN